MTSVIAHVRLAALLLATATLCACGARNLAPETPEGVSLAGAWHLNRQASQDPRAMLAQIQREVQQRMRSHRGPLDDAEGTGPYGGTQAAATRPPESVSRRPARRSSYEVALGTRLTSEGLSIEQGRDRLVIIRGDSRRSFTPGGHSVVSVADGVADQRSGWAGREYVIEVRPQVGPRVTERYSLSPDGRQLIEKLTLTEEGLPKLEFTRVYDPGAQPERALPGSN